MRLFVVVVPIVFVLLPACPKPESSEPPSGDKTTAAGDTAAPTKTPPKSAREATAPKTDADVALAKLRDRIAFEKRRADKDPKSFLPLQTLSGAYLARARIAGDLDDYQRAGEAIDEAFRRGAQGAGPWFARARHRFSIHRFAEAQTDLEKVLTASGLKASTKAAALGTLGDIAWHRGDYTTAEKNFAAARELHDTPSHIARIALFKWRTGDIDGGLAGLAEARAKPIKDNSADAAWLHLTSGIVELERDHLDAALAHIEQADAAFTGWYLVQEHKAEILAGLGRRREALSLYEKVMERNPSPEFMAAVAEVHDAAGQALEAKAWNKKAEAGYRAQLAAHPDASLGHALDFFVAADDPAFGLSLAEKNHAARGGGESATKLVQARYRAGQRKEALALLEDALKTPYSTWELHATAALVLRDAGETVRSGKHQKKAEALRKGALAELSWLKPPR